MNAPPFLAERAIGRTPQPAPDDMSDRLGRLLFLDHPDPLFLIECPHPSEFVIDCVNAAAADLLATTPDRLTGKPVSSIFTERDQKPARRTIAECWDSGSDRSCSLAFSRHSDRGRSRIMQVSMYDAGGERRLLLKIIAHRLRPDDAASGDTPDGDATVTERLMMSVSHELRTPLNGILGFAEILKDELFGPLGQPRYQEYARDIFYCGDLLLRRVEDLLALKTGPSQAEEHQAEEDWFDAAGAIDSAIELAESLAQRKQLRLGVVRDRTPIGLFGNETLFRKMIKTILLNCAEAAPEGSAVSVIVRGGPNKGLTISVQDEGGQVEEPRLKAGVNGLADGEPVTADKRPLTGLFTAESIARKLGGELSYSSGRQDSVHQKIVFSLPGNRVLNAS